MKKVILLSIALLSNFSYANSNINTYISLKTGISDLEFKDSVVTSNETNIFEYHNTTTNEASYYPNILLAIGYDFSKISNINLRSDFEYTYKDSKNLKTSFKNGYILDKTTNEKDTVQFDDKMFLFNHDIKIQSLMLNSYYDFKNDSNFTPFVSIGLGVTNFKKSSTSYYYNKDFLLSENIIKSRSDNTFTWSTGIGLAYQVSDNVSLEMSYKYIDAGKPKFKSKYVGDYDVTYKAKHIAEDYAFGIRYSF